MRKNLHHKHETPTTVKYETEHKKIHFRTSERGFEMLLKFLGPTLIFLVLAFGLEWGITQSRQAAIGQYIVSFAV